MEEQELAKLTKINKIYGFCLCLENVCPRGTARYELADDKCSLLWGTVNVEQDGKDLDDEMMNWGCSAI